MSTDTPNEPAGERPEGALHWRRNLWVAVFGSVTTLISMTLLVPFLPLYVEELGVHGHAAIAQWSGIAFGGTYLTSAIFAPVWGYASDRYGRKLMLMRASLGMGVSMSLIGIAQNVYELTGFRMLAGALGGYASGSNVMVAAQTPKAYSGWALGVLWSGVMAGNLAGPLIGGTLPPLMGIRNTFFLAGALIFVAFLATAFLMKEEPLPRPKTIQKKQGDQGWASIPDKRPVVIMLLSVFLFMFANLSIEPIITLYVAQFTPPERITLVAGLAMSAAALGSILSASRVGKYADRVGHRNVLIACFAACTALLIPQAFVTADWQLVLLRFLMGLALGGMLPCVISVIRHNVPEQITGRILGLSTSCQFLGGVVGPLAGGFVGGHVGMRSVFLYTSVLMAAGALMNWLLKPARSTS